MTTEAYPGQAEIAAGKLEELELLQRADEEQLKLETEPGPRAALLSRMASRAGSIAAQRRFVSRLNGEDVEPERNKSLRVRVTEAELTRLHEAAAEAGVSVSVFVRQACGL